MGGFIGLLPGLMVIIVFSNVVARYFLNSSLAWSEEISRFMLIWLAFLGSYLAFVRNEHLGLDLLVFLPPNPAIMEGDEQKTKESLSKHFQNTIENIERAEA